jgi:hypothetical protein
MEIELSSEFVAAALLSRDSCAVSAFGVISPLVEVEPSSSFGVTGGANIL